MVAKHIKQRITLTERFSLIHKMFMRTMFYGYIVIGAYGIYSESIFLGVFYSGFVIFGLFPLLLYCVCANCPYPYKCSDCLLLPFWLIKKLYKFRGLSMSITDKVGFIVTFAGLILIPQYWLLKNYTLLILFWIFCLPVLIIIPFYFCKRCQHFSCPFNLAKRE